MSNMTDITRHTSLVMDTSPMSQSRANTQELFHFMAGLQMVIFLAELNWMDLGGTDIGNAYLKAYMAKKLVIVGGPKFREMEGHILIISEALYGLGTSGLCWHDHFSECHCKMGVTSTKAEPDIWMWHDSDD
jgi:hypothetical protein